MPPPSSPPCNQACDSPEDHSSSAAPAAASGIPSGSAWSKWLQRGIVPTLILLVLAAYGWTLDFPLIFDDFTYLRDNPLFGQWEHFLYPFQFTEFANLPKQLNADPDLSVNFILRPVAYATFYLNYLLDGFNPRWYRAVNIVVHAANAVLFFLLLQVLLRGLKPGSRTFIAATAAATFAVHPMATESVTYITQRFTSLAAFFYLLALLLYFLSHGNSRHPGVLRASAVIVLLLGMLTKEFCVTAPIMAVVLDWLVLGTAFRSALRRALPLLVLTPLIPGSVLLTSAALHGGQLQITNAVNIVNSRDLPIHHWDYIVTQFTVVGDYLKRLVWPSQFNLDPDWPLYHSLRDGPVLSAILIFLTITGVLVWRHCGSRRQESRDPRPALALAGWIWFFVIISISSGLVPLPDLMADHRSYLPSCGIFAGIACLLDPLRVRVGARLQGARMMTALGVAMVLALSWITCRQNIRYESAVTMWTHSISLSAGKFRVWSNLGTALAEAGKDAEALDCFRKALELEPRFQGGFYNLAVTQFKLAQYQESLSTVQELVRLNPARNGDPKILYLGGLAMANLGKINEAIACLKDCAAVMPAHPDVHRVLGVLYLKLQQFPQALEALHRAAEITPADNTILDQINELEGRVAIN